MNEVWDVCLSNHFRDPTGSVLKNRNITVFSGAEKFRRKHSKKTNDILVVFAKMGSTKMLWINFQNWQTHQCGGQDLLALLTSVRPVHTQLILKY